MFNRSTEAAKWYSVIGISIGTAIFGADVTIVNTALPVIQRELVATTLQIQWVMNIFALLMCVLMTTMDRISDIVGRRLMLYIGIVLFGLSSLLAGFSPTANWLILFRALQGIATAIAFPASFALVSHMFSDTERGKAIGVWSGCVSLGMAAGPLLGGIITSLLNWHWIFFVNIPIIFIGFSICIPFTRESKSELENEHIDWYGFLFLSIAIGTLILATIEGPEWSWNNPWVLSLFLCFVVATLLFYFVEKRKHSPLIQLSIFQNKTYLAGSLSYFAMGFTAWSAFFFLPLYLFHIQEKTPFVIGLSLAPTTICLALLAFIIGRIVYKVGYRILILVGLVLFLAVSLAFANFPAQGHYAYIIVVAILLGIGMGLVSVPSSTAAMATTHKNIAGMASGALITMPNLGGALGLALIGSMFRQQYANLLQHKLAALVNLTATQTHLIAVSTDKLKMKTLLAAQFTPVQIKSYYQLYQTVFLQAFHQTMWILFAIVFFIFLCVVWLFRKRVDNVQ